MIASLRGAIRKVGPDHLVVEVGGVGFRVFVAATTLSQSGTVGDVVSLVTHLQVREDVLALYGFSNEDELTVFELFLNVSGVGPRVALSLLSAAPVDALRAAIADGNVGFFTRVPGIGRRRRAASSSSSGEDRVRRGRGGAFAGLGTGRRRADELGYSAAEARRRSLTCRRMVS